MLNLFSGAQFSFLLWSLPATYCTSRPYTQALNPRTRPDRPPPAVPTATSRAPLATFSVPATEGLPLVRYVAATYPETNPRHLVLQIATFVNAGFSAFHTHTRPERSLGEAKPFVVRDFFKAVVWDEQGKPHTGSHILLVLQTGARRFPHLAPGHRSTLDHPASRLTSFREAFIPCWMNKYLLRRNCFVEAMVFTSIPSVVDPSLRNLVGQKGAWLSGCLHMGRPMYEASHGLSSKLILWQESIEYAERALHISDRHRYTWAPLSSKTTFVSLLSLSAYISFFRAGVHWGTVSLQSTESGGGVERDWGSPEKETTFYRFPGSLVLLLYSHAFGGW